MRTPRTSSSFAHPLVAIRSGAMILLPHLAFVLAGCSDPPTLPTVPPPAQSVLLANDVQPLAATWTQQTLPAYPGKTGARANDISDRGILVGESFTVPYGTDEQPVYWKQDKVYPLSTGGATTGFATAISDNGIFVVGYTKWYLRQAKIQRAVLWTMAVANPPAVALPTCGRTGDPIATGVNNKGVIVGQIGLTAVTWANASSCPTGIIVAGKMMTLARGINDVNTKVGLGHWNTWSPRGFASHLNTALAPLSGHAWTDAHAVNDANVVVGRSWYPGSSSSMAVYWVSSGPVFIGTMSNGARVAISDKGRFVWGTPNSNGMTKLGNAVHALAASPLGVNLCGDIVGVKNGQAVHYKKAVCD